MFCPECGTRIDNTVKFCPNCGAALPASAPETGAAVETGPEKPRKKWLFVLIPVLIIAILAVSGTVIYFNSPARTVETQLSSGAYTRALNTYNNRVSDNFLWQHLTDFRVTAFIEELQEAYEDGSCSYEEVMEALEILEQFDSETIEAAAQEAIETIAAMQISSDLFAEAEELYEEGSYVEAMELYAEISTDSADYVTAQSQIDECMEEYIAEILERTASASTQSEYKTAISLIDVALGVFPDSTELQNRQAELNEAYYALVKSEAMTAASDAVAAGDYETALKAVDEALTQLGSDTDLSNLRSSIETDWYTIVKTEATATASEAIETGDYAAALEAIDEALAVLGSDADLSTLRSSAQSSCESTVADQVAELLEIYDYDSALELLQEALQVFPESAVILELYETTEAEQPVKLSELTLSESGGDFVIASEDETYTDTIGNAYQSDNLYYVEPAFWSNDEAYVKYYLGGEYSAFTFTLAVAINESSYKNTRVLTIYGDENEVLYTSGEIDRTTVPQVITIDVSGTDWLYIDVTNTSGSKAVGLLLDNPMLFK